MATHTDIVEFFAACGIAAMLVVHESDEEGDR